MLHRHTVYANKSVIVLKGSDVVKTDVGFCSLWDQRAPQRCVCQCACVCAHHGVPLGRQMELVGGFCQEDLAGVASCYWVSFNRDSHPHHPRKKEKSLKVLGQMHNNTTQHDHPRASK